MQWLAVRPRFDVECAKRCRNPRKPLSRQRPPRCSRHDSFGLFGRWVYLIFVAYDCFCCCKPIYSQWNLRMLKPSSDELNRAPYWTARVTPGWLLTVPTVRTTAAELPGVTFAGIRNLTWTTPAITSGPASALNTSALKPPI